MNDLTELINTYYNHTFIFQHLYKNSVIYKKEFNDKTVLVYGELDNRSSLKLEETLDYLNTEIEITNIDVNIKYE